MWVCPAQQKILDDSILQPVLADLQVIWLSDSCNHNLHEINYTILHVVIKSNSTLDVNHETHHWHTMTSFLFVESHKIVFKHLWLSEINFIYVKNPSETMKILQCAPSNVFCWSAQVSSFNLWHGRQCCHTWPLQCKRWIQSIRRSFTYTVCDYYLKFAK
jgi:hypothetical protein